MFARTPLRCARAPLPPFVVRVPPCPPSLCAFPLCATPPLSTQATPLLLGLGLAVGVFGARSALTAYKAFQAMPKVAAVRAFYKGGFEDKMSRREAALILGIRYVGAPPCGPATGAMLTRPKPSARPVHRETAPKSKIKEVHRRIMIANHPDRGGSPYLASKVNEAKERLEKPN